MGKDTSRGPTEVNDSSESAEPVLMIDAAPVIDSRGAVLKWVVGAVAVAVLVGGGFAAWNTAQRSAVRTEIAAADVQPSAAPLVAPAAPATVFDPAATTEVVPTPASGLEETASAPANPQRPRAKPRSEIVPGAVLGVTPAGPAAQEDEIVVTAARRPVWTRTPNARRLAAAYPVRALERGREGEASIRCMVQEGGALDCTRVSEFPARAGFGKAALRIARSYRHAPQRWDGRDAVGTPVNLRVVFRIDDGDRRRG